MKLNLILFLVFLSLASCSEDLYQEAMSSLSKNPAKGIALLEEVAYKFNHQQSLHTLANYFLFNSSTRRNATIAFKYFSQLASLGIATGHLHVGLMYATGIGVERDYAKAHLYIGLAVIGGDILAAQVMGYWKMSGIATLKSCDDAAFYYGEVADAVSAEFYASHPLGKNLPEEKKNIPEIEFGGIYGNGVSGPGNPKVQKESEGLLSTSDIVEYYTLQADGGEKTAQILVAQVLYMGSGSVKVDYVKARKYALTAFKQNPIDENQKFSKNDFEKYSISGNAADLLGKMYWRGEGVERNDVIARRWFQKGAAVNNAACMYALGLMYEEGVADLQKDPKKALYYFNEAAALDSPNALVKLALRRGDAASSFSRLQKASGKGNLMGTYYLARHYFKGIGVTANCVTGIGLLKRIIQKADWHQPLTKIGDKLYEAGDFSGSFIAYIFAGELGYQTSQTNAAWILDQRRISHSDYSRIFTVNTTEKDRYLLAYPLWNRAANQGNVDARIKLGDYYFQKHLGQEFLNSSERYEKAAKYYKLAADHEFSAIAMWNLAYMYETGLGVARDYYLAKRMYDLCLSTNPAGYISVDMALLKVYLKWAWSWLKGEKVQSLFTSSPSLDAPKSIHKEDDLYSMDDEHDSIFNRYFLLIGLIGLATIVYYIRQQIGAYIPLNRQPLPNDEELEPILNDGLSD